MGGNSIQNQYQNETVNPTQPFFPTPGKKYKIASAKSPGFVLDASKNPANLNKLILWEAHGGPDQQWEFVPNGDNTFCIKNAGNDGTL